MSYGILGGLPTHFMFTTIQGKHNMSIYNTIYTSRPYFYIIQDVVNGMYYAGVKYSKDSDPSLLLKENGYKTSSYYVKKLIEENGLSRFTIRTIRCFRSKTEALRYETRFLERVDAANNPKFYNMKNSVFGKMNLVSSLTKEKRKQTNIKKYGVECTFSLERVREQIENTNLLRYGVKNPLQCPEIVERRNKTNVHRYGVECIFSNPSFVNKIKKTLILRYGTEHPMQNQEVKDSWVKKTRERYGYDYTLQLPEVRKKIQETNIKKYGHSCVLQSDEIREKFKKANMDKYGVEHHFSSPELVEKFANRTRAKNSRPSVMEIKGLRKVYSISIPRGWNLKDDEYVDELLASILSDIESGKIITKKEQSSINRQNSYAKNRNKIKKRRLSYARQRLARPLVQLIIETKKAFGCKIGTKGWWQQDDDYLELMWKSILVWIKENVKSTDKRFYGIDFCIIELYNMKNCNKTGEMINEI